MLPSRLTIQHKSNLKPESENDRKVYAALHTFAGQSKSVFIYPHPRPLTIEYRPENKFGKPGKHLDSAELSVYQITYRMTACAKNGIRPGVIITHRMEDGGDMELEFLFDALTWNSLHAVYAMTATFLYHGKQLGRPKKVRI